MRKLVQEPALVHMLDLLDHISIATTAGGSDDIFVEGEGDESRDDEQIDDGAEGTSTFGYLLLGPF